MSKRNPKARWPLPLVVNPPGVRCYQIPVPDDIYHLAAFRGAIFELAKAYSWANDDAHTAKDVAAVWMEIFSNLERCADCPPNTGYAGAGGGDDDPMIRQNPDNPCELQNSVNGVDWCTWADLSLCVSGSQPGEGAQQPVPGGGEACYAAKLQASGYVLVPTVVNTGDAVSLVSVSGAGTDGGSNWYCPDGNIFFAGACLGGAGFDGTDPLPSVAHMKIIAKIGAVYYDLTNGPITVGAGITNGQVTIQVNDATLSDNYGEYSLNVCVTNNQQASWRRIIDLSLGIPLGWTRNAGLWTPGAGVDYTDDIFGSICYRSAQLSFTMPTGSYLNQADVTFNQTNGSYDVSGSDAAQFIRIVGVATVWATYSSMIAGTNVVRSGSAAAVNGVVDVVLACSAHSSSACGSNTGSGRLLKIILAGQGVTPSWGVAG